jgi:hypothetical protein
LLWFWVHKTPASVSRRRMWQTELPDGERPGPGPCRLQSSQVSHALPCLPPPHLRMECWAGCSQPLPPNGEGLCSHPALSLSSLEKPVELLSPHVLLCWMGTMIITSTLQGCGEGAARSTRSRRSWHRGSVSCQTADNGRAGEGTDLINTRHHGLSTFSFLNLPCFARLLGTSHHVPHTYL